MMTWDIDGPPRWIRLSVAWTPTPRDQPIEVGWTVNGIPRYTFQATHSWPTREIALRPGDTLVLLASQATAGQLACWMHEGGKVVAHDLIDGPGNAKCMIIG